jgi:hypothetical protein
VQQCIVDTFHMSLPPAGVTVARFSQRLAAGVGVFAAFLLLGGSAAVAVADPGGSHSDRGSSSDRGNGRGNGRGGPDRHDDNRHSYDGRRGDSYVGRPGGGPDSKRGDVSRGSDKTNGADPGVIESPQARVGSGRDDVAEPAPRAAARSGATTDMSEARTSAVAPSEAAPSAAIESVVGSDAPIRSGSDHAAPPSAAFESPRVAVGNGREPVIKRGAPEPLWQAPAFPPAPAAPPPVMPPPPAAPVVTPPSRVNPKPEAPVLTQQLGVAPAADWSNPLWGLAGLLLIPVAGAALGYRQARAAHAAERLRRS